MTTDKPPEASHPRKTRRRVAIAGSIIVSTLIAAGVAFALLDPPADTSAAPALPTPPYQLWDPANNDAPTQQPIPDDEQTSPDDITEIIQDTTRLLDGHTDPGSAALIELVNSPTDIATAYAAVNLDPQYTNITTIVTAINSVSNTECTNYGVTTPCAHVTYDLLVEGNLYLVGLTAWAIPDNHGGWTLTAHSYCDFAALGGHNCTNYQSPWAPDYEAPPGEELPPADPDSEVATTEPIDEQTPTP